MQICSIQGVCNTPLRWCNSLINGAFHICGAYYIRLQRRKSLEYKKRCALALKPGRTANNERNLLYEHFLHSAVAHPYYVYALLRGGEARAVGGVTFRLRGGGGFGCVLYASSYVEEVFPMCGGFVGIQTLLRNIERACVLVNANKGSPQLISEYRGRCGMAYQLFEVVAISESPIAYASDGAGDDNRGETVATQESTIAYARDGIGYIHRDKARTIRVFTTDYYSIFYR